MRTKQTTIQPQDSAFNKVYFVNMLSGKSYNYFNEALYEESRLCQIADKLKAEELQYLIDKIESIR